MTTNAKTIIFDIGFNCLEWITPHRPGLIVSQRASQPSAGPWPRHTWHWTLGHWDTRGPVTGALVTFPGISLRQRERRRHLYFMTFWNSAPTLPISMNICHRHHTLWHLRVGISQHYQASRRANTGSWPLTQVSDWQLRTQHSNLVLLTTKIDYHSRWNDEF